MGNKSSTSQPTEFLIKGTFESGIFQHTRKYQFASCLSDIFKYTILAVGATYLLGITSESVSYGLGCFHEGSAGSGLEST
ncbi:MAG TPA: hypothetical protein VFI73_03300 [Candidatus Nitrosopolaris sp.]|nr:hypothetical protein [Candidatus Nitrosopolaris sp.]